MSKNYIHSESCHQTDNTLRYGQRLAVAGRISPCHGQLLALQVLNTAEVMDDLFHVCKALCRMVNVALQVDKSRLLLEDTVFMSLCDRIHEGLLIGMSFADIHIITDTDDVSHEGNHVRRLSDSFTVSDLALLLVQILYFQTKQVAG